MKATDLLRKQHHRIDELLDLLEDVDGVEDRETLLDEIAGDLAAHMLIEEDQFYPAVKAQLGQDSGVDESIEEHTMTALALKLLLAVGVADRSFDAKLCILRELIDGHVDEEHEEMFPAVEELFDQQVLHDLGAEMEDSFRAMRAHGAATLLARYPALQPLATAASPR